MSSFGTSYQDASAQMQLPSNATSDFENTYSYSGMGGGSAISDSLESIQNYAKAIADSASSIGAGVNISNESLAAMRASMEAKSSQKPITLTPNITINTGDIRNGLDIRQIAYEIARILDVEIAASSAAY